MVKFIFFCHKTCLENERTIIHVPQYQNLTLCNFSIFLWWDRHFLNSSKSEWIIRKYFTPLCPTIVSKSTKTTWNLSFWQNNITLLLYHNGDEIISGGAYVCSYFHVHVFQKKCFQLYTPLRNKLLCQLFRVLSSNWFQLKSWGLF